MSSISVIIPAKNEEENIGIAVDSVMNQTRTADEVFVIDDKSSDSTGEVAERHGATVIQGKGKGIGWAEHLGLQESTGDYVSVLCGDDWWPPWTLKVQAKLMSKGYGLVHGQAAEVDDGNQVVRVYGRPSRFDDFAWGNSIIEDTVMARRHLMMIEGGYDTRLQRSQDMDMWVKVCRVSRFKFIPRVLLYRRLRTQGKKFRGRYFLSKVLLKHGFLSRDHLELYWRSRGRIYISAMLLAALEERNIQWLRHTGLLDESGSLHVNFPR